jgi:glycosyltransferase involved in cell wall biosynthesis
VVVLHVLEALGGGTARHLVDAIRHTPGIDQHVAVPLRRVGWLSDDTAFAALQGAGAEVHRVEMRRSPSHPRNALALLQLARLVRRLRPDIVHTHSSIGGALGRVAAAGTAATPVHTPHAVAAAGWALSVEKLLGRLTAVHIAVSPSEGDLLVGLGLARADAVRVVPNGIDVDEVLSVPFDLRDRLGLAPDTPLVGTISRLVPQKAPEVYVRACAAAAERLPGVHFVLIGSGTLASMVTAEIERVGMSGRIHLHPDFPLPAAVLSQFDLFVSASRFEGGPYTPLEALRAGLPVLLTAATGNRDVVEHGVSGWLAPVDQPQALAEAMVRLMGDEDLRRALALAGAARLRERFDVRDMGRALAGLYEDLTDRGPGPRSLPR